jgi:hypothetical protein
VDVLRKTALAAALGAALACSSATPEECPGQLIGTFSMQGTLVSASCAAGPPAGYAALVPGTVSFTATLAYDPATQAATLCVPRRLATRFLGTRTGDHLAVSTTDGGAVLGGCSPVCAATVLESVEGDLSRDATGQVTAFTGTLADHASDAGPAGSCGACQLPCEARYAITGTM